MVRSVLILILAINTLVAADPKIYLTISIDRKASFEVAQSWTHQLGKVDLAQLRILASENGTTSITISEQGQRYDVYGLIDRESHLHLPGGQFQINQLSKLQDWHAKVVSGELTRPQKSRSAFGLSSKQLVTLFDQLSKPVDFETNGKSTGAVVVKIRDTLGIRIGVSPAAKSNLKPAVSEELKGLSAGTTLAAILRPLGLVLVPQLDDNEVVLAIADVRESVESWPVGWPPEKQISELVPKLLGRLNAEIADTSLANVLDAIQRKLQVPFLYDQNTLARNEVDLQNAIVKYPARPTFYKKVIDNILTNHLLEAEIRVDESGKPFIWITSSRH